MTGLEILIMMSKRFMKVFLSLVILLIALNPNLRAEDVPLDFTIEGVAIELPAGSYKETITIINHSNYPIKRVKCIAQGSGQESAHTEFGPVAIQNKKTAQFTAWSGGPFAVVVEYEQNGQIVTSRPFASSLNQGRALKSVILTFGESKRKNRGVWKAVSWETETQPVSQPQNNSVKKDINS